MELGVSEEFAHKLATDRNMTDIKSLSHDEIASTLGISKDSESFPIFPHNEKQTGWDSNKCSYKQK